MNVLVFLLNRFVVTLAALAIIAGASAWYVAACPFCSAINLTFSDQIKANDIVVIAKLLEIPAPVNDSDAELPKSQFEVVNVIKGKEFVPDGAKFRSLLIGRYPLGQEFLVMGVDPPNVAWSTPMKASDRVVDYLEKIQKLPKDGVQRLEFFQKYFEDDESVLAFDAYDEFAKAPYKEITALRDKMDRPQLVQWIKDSNTSINRRRLYLTMLGVCGQAEDIEMLEEFIKSGDRKKQAGLDALIACYLTLNGDQGVTLIEDTFLKDKTVEYVDTLAAVSALRFHGTETKTISKEKIVGAIRLLLDRPKMADMIIPDLARWEDWSVMERLVQMFKDADEETNWLRVPVISYLRACPDPKAKKYISELREIDPDAVRRADFFLDFEDDEDSPDDAPKAEDKPGGNQNGGDGQDGDPSSPPGNTSLSTAPQSQDEQPVYILGVGDSAVLATDHDQTESKPHTVLRIPMITAGQTEAEQQVALATPSNATTSTLATSAQAGTRSATPVSDIVVPAATPVASAQTVKVAIAWQIVFVPMLISIAIFVLLWSVINGWFERLIF